MAECPGSDRCTCPPPYVWADQLRRDHAHRLALTQIRAELEAGTVSLAAAGTAIGVLIAEDPIATRSLIRQEMAGDASQAQWVRTLQARGSSPRWMTAEVIARADLTEQLLAAVGLGVESAGRALEAERYLALTGSAQRTRAVPGQVRHRMLSDPGVRRPRHDDASGQLASCAALPRWPGPAPGWHRTGRAASW